MTTIPRLKERYISEIRPQLKKKYNYPNDLAVPAIVKIVLNIGVGAAAQDKKLLTKAIEELTKIAGQKAVETYARKSIAGFKIRAGWPIGCKVTLRRAHMYEFLDRLISIAIPRIRDFRGISSKFDGRGNLSIGIREQIVFPEINFDEVEVTRGLVITIATTARTNAEGKALLEAFNFPFKDKEKSE